MALLTSAVVGNDEARCELVRSQLAFFEEPLAPLEQADIAWLLEDEYGHYPKVKFLGPVILVGRFALTTAQDELGPIVVHTSWPLVYRITQQSLAIAYRAVRELQDNPRPLCRTDLFDSNSEVARSHTSGNLLSLNGSDLKSHLANIEQRLIEQALADSNAVVARAADRLRIRRTTLVEKMRKYGIKRAC